MKITQIPPVGFYEKALSPSIKISQKLQAAKNFGFDFIEVSVDESDEFLAKLDWPTATRRELFSLSQDLDLPIHSLCMSGLRRFPLGSADEATRLKGQEMLAKGIDLASDLGARVIQILGYWVYHEEIAEQSEYHYTEGLKWAAERAAKQGIMLGIENVDSHYQVNSITKAIKLIKEINSPWVQLYLDFANLAAFGFDIPSELEAGKGHFAALHVKDVLPEEVRGIQYGSGMVDFISAFNKLAEIGYYGPMLLEMWHDDSQDMSEVIANALHLLKSQLADSNYNTTKV